MLGVHDVNSYAVVDKIITTLCWMEFLQMGFVVVGAVVAGSSKSHSWKIDDCELSVEFIISGPIQIWKLHSTSLP